MKTVYLSNTFRYYPKISRSFLLIKALPYLARDFKIMVVLSSYHI